MATTEQLAHSITTGNRSSLARVITLIESTRPDHRSEAWALLQLLLPETGRAIRIGITGVPGAGKSTFIDQLGVNLLALGHRIAVLAIDPTSTRTGGSILGDKTRMGRLAASREAFIRPSPSGANLGGVARRTRETLLAVEAAGFDIVIVETVGIGQSEMAVAGMVDFFCVVAIPGAGDELQGIKRGVLEIADMIVVNKADGPNQNAARRAAAELSSAVQILTPLSENWRPPVLAASAIENTGLDKVWEEVLRHRALKKENGELDARRRSQAVQWFRDLAEERVLEDFYGDERVSQAISTAESDVAAGRKISPLAAEEVLNLWRAD